VCRGVRPVSLQRGVLVVWERRFFLLDGWWSRERGIRREISSTEGGEMSLVVIEGA